MVRFAHVKKVVSLAASFLQVRRFAITITALYIAGGAYGAAEDSSGCLALSRKGPSRTSHSELGAIAVIRTLLNYFLEQDLERGAVRDST
jgi:hypothetical protein